MNAGPATAKPGVVSRDGRRPQEFALLVLAALTLVSGWIRFTATSFGLPEQFRPDEEVLVPKALDLDGSWNPHWAVYPAAHTYLLREVLDTYALTIGGGQNLNTVFDRNEALAFLIARELSAAMGTATTLAVYAAAAPSYGAVAALASAAIVTVATIHVRESKFAKLQVPAALWLTLAIAMMLRIVRRGRLSDYALAGFFTGFATATHYSAGVIAFGVLAAHMEACAREHRSLLTGLTDRRIYIAGAVAILTFFCVTPYVFLDPGQTAHDFARIRAWRGLPQAAGWWWLSMRLLPDSLGGGLLIFLLASAVWVLFRPRPGTITLLGSIAVTILSMTLGHPALMYRYAVNPLMLMVFPAGVFVADLVDLAAARLGTPRGPLLIAMLFAMTLAPSLMRDIQLNRLLLQTDTRTLAAEWIAAHIPPGTSIALARKDRGFGTPQPGGRYKLVPTRDLALLRAKDIFWVISDDLPGLAYYSPAPSAAQLAVLNSSATLLFEVDPVRAGAQAPVLDSNDAFYAPIQHITSMERPGPRIRIWRLNSSLP